VLVVNKKKHVFPINVFYLYLKSSFSDSRVVSSVAGWRAAAAELAREYRRMSHRIGTLDAMGYRDYKSQSQWLAHTN